MRWKLAYMCCFLYIVLIISLDSQPVQQGMDRRKDLEKGQKSVWEFSQFFHRWNIGLSQSKLKTSVSAAAATKQMRTVMGMFSKFTAAAAGILGTIGALFSFALLFVPKTDSPELQQMKRTYSVMNERLNSISSSIDELKNIIPLENQKAVYKDHELRIKAAYSAFTMCQDMIIDAQCTTEQECFRKRTIIAGNFRNDLDISTHVYAVAKGSVDDGVFGRSLLDLLKESSKCDLSQINSITTGIAMLIFKGMVVVSFKNRISLPDYDDSNDAEYLSSALTNLEAKRQEIEKSCLKDVDIFMMNDLQNSKSKMSADTQRTNEAILPFFKAKYFWNDWFVASFVSEKDPENWPRDSILGNLHVKSEQHNVHTIAWPIYKDPVNAFSIKRTHLIQIYLQQNGSMINMVNKISESPYIRNQIKSLYSIFASQNFIISYYRENGEMNHTYSTSSNANPNSYSLRQGNYLLTYFNVSAEPFACNLDCHGQGECILYPHSNQMFCRCHPGFFGESCNETRNSEQMKRDIGKLMSTTLKLPSISSLKFQLEDSIALLQMSFENMSDAFSNIENMINNKFKSFGSLMARIEEWNQVRAQYQDSVQKISYLANFYHGNLRLSNWNMTLMSNILGKIPAGRMSPCRRRQEIASMLDPLTLRKWISDINYLIIGRNDNFLTQHRPLIFIVMDKMKDRVCYPDYKAKIDLAFSQLVALQLQGYMVWEMVLVFLGLETTPLVASYKQVIAKQNETLRNMTCTANIPNSRNFVSCLGGFFIHPKLDVDVVCVEQFYPREQKRLWVQSVESFSSQYTVLAWGVSKLIGAPRVYPRYTHGIDAWKQAQNKLREMQFLTVKFPERLFPEEVRIYEVFNAGAVKKIEVLRPDSKWMTIWETSIVRDIKHSRIFSPYFKTLPVLVDTINVTIDPRKANDYVAIDAMMMIGRPQQNDEHFLWNAAIGWSNVQSQGQKFITINLGLNLFVENVTIYEKGNPCAVIGVEAEYEHSQWVTITLAERMKNEERSKWFSPGLKAPSQKTRQIKVISYPRDDRLVPDIDGISVLGRSKLKDTCSKLSVTSCVPCECDKDGSTSLKCDVNGKCKCKDHYIGRRCDSRDCGYTAWTSWTGCNDCNVHGKKESRNRTETHSWKGNGRMCPALYEVRNCTFKQCDCHNGEYGPNCSKRDCVVSQWGNWDRSCTDNCRWNGVRRRTRSKEVDVKGDGRPCPSTIDTITCPYIRCSYHCARLPNYRRVCKWSKY